MRSDELDTKYVDSAQIKILWKLITLFASILIGGGSLWASSVKEDMEDIQDKAEEASELSKIVSVRLSEIERRMIKVEGNQDKIYEKTEDIMKTQHGIKTSLEILIKKKE